MTRASMYSHLSMHWHRCYDTISNSTHKSSEATMVLSAVSAVLRAFKLSFTGFPDANTSSNAPRVRPLVSGTDELAMLAQA